MERILSHLEFAIDIRQTAKVRHKMGDCIALTFLAELSNANTWEEVEIFGKEHEDFLRKYLVLSNGIPSHDTIQRVFAIVSPELLDTLNVKGHIITIDAMGTQKEIVKKIRKKRADYVLGLKKNHGNLHEDVKLYFDDPDLLKKCGYEKTNEKARGGMEKREYWQTEDIDWLDQKKEWAGLTSIAMTRNTIVKNGEISTETRYFISSLPQDAKEISRAIRGHWMVESYHWHLDVTFREDDDRTLEKQASFNRNILKKLALNVLKVIDVGKKSLSLARKRFTIGTNPEKHLERILSL
jgi:predicted transposase YbfD/YdcC